MALFLVILTLTIVNQLSPQRMQSKLLFYSLIFLFLPLMSSAQNMQEGFDFLETGKYEKAKTFFNTILEQYPDNKTARLCYGRSIGLLGNSKEAVLIFISLKNDYPDDFEVKLNYAESLLWDKQYTDAEVYYEKLIAENATSFPAVLGYANTLSNVKKYQKALDVVNKALNIQEKNPNALLSRKYIRLGYANTMVQDKRYDEALTLLDLNLADFKNDKDTQRSKAAIFLMTNDLSSAELTYRDIATNPKDSIMAMNGLALVAHKQHKEKKALNIAGLATNKVQQYKEEKELYLSTRERYIQALLWNRKFKRSKMEIQKLESLYPNNSRVLALQATHGMYTSDFKTSLENYESILEKSEDSFDGNLGIANAYKAVGHDMNAFRYAFKTLAFYPKQPDAEKLIQTLKTAHTPFIEEKTAFTFDNGDNEAITMMVRAEIPLSVKFRPEVQYDYRITKNTITNNEASSHDFSAGFLYKFNGGISLKSKIGITNANGFTNDYTALISEVIVKTIPFRLQNLDIGYKRELQNFNADLLNREIVMNNYFLNYNLGTNINLGWYTQYMYTSQTDDNTRGLLFTSLYYNVLQRPVLKVGINYQHITFKNQVPVVYFSPKKFNLGEVFAEVVSDPQKQLFYSANAAFGQQFVEEDPRSSTFRATGKFGARFSDRFIANIYGLYSNIASATAAGFEYIEFGFKLKWYFLRKPIFDKKNHGS